MNKLIRELKAFCSVVSMPEKNTQSEAWYLSGYADAKVRIEEILSRHSTTEGELRGVIIAKCEALIKESKDGNSTFDSGVARSAQSVLWEVLNFKSTPTKATEPLAVLVFRKIGGHAAVVPPSEKENWWSIVVYDQCCKIVDGFHYPTYAECEAQARQYLEGLPDVKGGE